MSEHGQASLLEHSKTLFGVLKDTTQTELKKLMHLSDSLAELNFDRNQSLTVPTTQTGKQALFAFKGDVYQSLAAEAFDHQQIKQAQKQLFILSGLYGLLEPLDLIQPHRLEMGTKLSTERGSNLYEFWGNRVTTLLDQKLQEVGANALVNLASQEYSKVVDFKSLSTPVIQVDFKEVTDSKARTIGIYAKKARGAMARFLVTEAPQNTEDLKSFNWEGYAFNSAASSGSRFVFDRPKP